MEAGSLPAEASRRDRAQCVSDARKGLRFRKYRRDLPGKPEIVFAGSIVAVFVDGDYWHCHAALACPAEVFPRQ
jgi:G:T-mismatch repair DNA endonuclease (very short patch repair protein)